MRIATTVCLALVAASFLQARASAATVFSTDFESGTLHPGLEDVTSAFTIAGGTISKTSYDSLPDSTQYRYVRTTDSDYFATGDFVYEVSFTNPNGAMNFIGVGAGMHGGGINEPVGGSLNFRIHPTDVAGGRVDLAYNFGDLDSAIEVGIGFISSFGTHRARISSSGNILTFELDEQYSGTFVPTITKTIDLNTNPTFSVALAGLATESRMFFGTDTTTNTYDDFLVSVTPVPEPVSGVYFAVGALGLALARRGRRA